MRDTNWIIAVYIMANRRNGTIYTGVTGNLVGRVLQHRNPTVESFAQEHGCKTLVWFEPCDTMMGAITREKQIKKWRRAWKLALIEKSNPQWLDLAGTWFAEVDPTALEGRMGPFQP